ncbi:hypothetical protein [Streptomyces sp. NPDC054854]
MDAQPRPLCGPHQMIPGRPHSFVVELETGRTSWTAVLDAVRPEPGTEPAALTASQLRDVVDRLLHHCLRQREHFDEEAAFSTTVEQAPQAPQAPQAA